MLIIFVLLVLFGFCVGFRDFFGFFRCFRKVGLYRYQITASWPLKCRFVSVEVPPRFCSCPGSSESRYKGTKISPAMQAFSEFIFDLFQMLKSVSVTRYNVS